MPPVNIQDGEQEYEVETVLDSTKIQEKRHFLVKWKGYGANEERHRECPKSFEGLWNVEATSLLAAEEL